MAFNVTGLATGVTLVKTFVVGEVFVMLTGTRGLITGKKLKPSHYRPGQALRGASD